MTPIDFHLLPFVVIEIKVVNGNYMKLINMVFLLTNRFCKIVSNNKITNIESGLYLKLTIEFLKNSVTRNYV